MLRPNLKYLKFDDRKILIIGVPILTLLIPFMFYGIKWSDYLSHFPQEFVDSFLFTTVFALLMRYLIIQLRKRYEKDTNPLNRLGTQFIILIVAVPPLMFILGNLLNVVHLCSPLDDFYEPTPMQSYGVTYFTLLSFMSMYEAVYFFYQYKQAIIEKEQLQKVHIQSQLDNLRNQINPHFLFNSMNTLMNLIPVDADRAMNYLSKLSKFYRYTVSNQEQSLVSLQKELDNVAIYADLLKERFHQGIDIHLPQKVTSTAQIIPLCLQLLIENAVKHNIVATKTPLSVQIQLMKEGTYIEVSNNIQQKIQSVESTGMGLKNIQSRVAYFTDAPVLISSTDGFFKVGVPLIEL